MTEEQWDRTFKTNIYGYFYMAKAALAHMRRRIGDRQHRIDHRSRGQQRVARLFVDKRRDSRVYEIAGPEPGGARYSRELRCAWTSLDTAESIGQESGRRS